ncbi:hypothetical protein ACQCX2_07740 [Propionibacteriaceae bacterium Y1700]|uniref:hypothetical protein n=1 Tax=Microlunatus sp. Y1700 TaxID=3418487 RepID=UPI003DA794F0
MTDHLSAHRTRSNVPSRREVAPRSANSPDPVPEYPTPPAGVTAPRIGERVITADGAIREFTGEGWRKVGEWDTSISLTSAREWEEFWADQDPDMHPYDNIVRGEE